MIPHCIQYNKAQEDSNVYPDSKIHGANMGPTWVLLAPDEPHVGPMNLAIRVYLNMRIHQWTVRLLATVWWNTPLSSLWMLSVCVAEYYVTPLSSLWMLSVCVAEYYVQIMAMQDWHLIYLLRTHKLETVLTIKCDWLPEQNWSWHVSSNYTLTSKQFPTSILAWQGLIFLSINDSL